MKMKLSLRKLLTLFLTFLKIGAFTFGGGYAMIALLENEFVSKKKWLSNEEFLDIVAVAESTPGPIAVNSATYIGYKSCGILGSTVATLGVCLPSFIIIYVISLFFDSFLNLKLIGYAFNGIKVCVVYLIFNAGLKMVKGLKKNGLNIFIFIAVTFVFIIFSLFAIKFSTILYILICGIIGVFVYFLCNIRKDGNG